MGAMRDPLKLAGWILLLGILELATVLLDRSHHLVWGRGGLLLLKASYLAFASVLLARFLSFRTRKTFESMLDSYTRIVERPWAEAPGFGTDWPKLVFHLALLLVASTNFLTPWVWRETAFKASILLDLLFWSLALRWVVRAHWLRSLGRKERLKEDLDDARSRARAETAYPPPRLRKTSPWAFVGLFLLAVGATAAVTLERWRSASRVYRIGDLKACMQACLERGLERFHREGRLPGDLERQPCLAVHRESVDLGAGFQRGELLLWAIEKPDRDYLGNGKPGDEGLMLDAEGRFRRTGGR